MENHKYPKEFKIVSLKRKKKKKKEKKKKKKSSCRNNTWNFQNLKKSINPQVQKAQRDSCMRNMPKANQSNCLDLIINSIS